MSNYLWIIAILLILWSIRKRRKSVVAVLQIQKQRKQNKEILAMKELAKQFIGKECIVYVIASDDVYIRGVIKEIDDDGMVIVRKSGEQEIVNLDFVTRIREYPRKKNGKKKEIVLD